MSCPGLSCRLAHLLRMAWICGEFSGWKMLGKDELGADSKHDTHVVL